MPVCPCLGALIATTENLKGSFFSKIRRCPKFYPVQNGPCKKTLTSISGEPGKRTHPVMQYLSFPVYALGSFPPSLFHLIPGPSFLPLSAPSFPFAMLGRRKEGERKKEKESGESAQLFFSRDMQNENSRANWSWFSPRKLRTVVLNFIAEMRAERKQLKGN